MLEEKPKTKKEEHLENLKDATKVARNSLILIFFLTLMKAFGGYVTNIVALIGDAVGSFADIIASTGIYAGLKLSQKKATGTFQYGFHRVETLVSLLISILILYLGYQISITSFERFFVTAETGAHSLGIITAIISIVASIFSFRYQRKMGDKINSNALLASAYDKRNDALVSVGVLGSIVADKFKIPYIEGGIGMGIALLIIWSGLKYGREALLALLDAWNEPKVESQIRSILEKSRMVTAVKKVRLRHVGTFIYGEALLEINPFTDLKDLRSEIHRLDRKIEEQVEHLGDLVLYIDPPVPVFAKVAIPISKENGLHSQIIEDSTKEFQFFIVEIRGGGIQNFYSLPDIFKMDDIGRIAQFLKKEGVNILISSLIRPLLYYNLRLNNIKVYPHFLDVKDVENTVKLLLLDI